MKKFVHLLLLATLAGSVDFKLWKTDKTFRLFILKKTEGIKELESEQR